MRQIPKRVMIVSFDAVGAKDLEYLQTLPNFQRFFEQAIFIVRNDAAGEGVTSRELVEEARRVARNYAGGDHGRFSRAWRELSPAVYTMMGAAGIGLLWLTVALI